jgi:hypothetical protein
MPGDSGRMAAERYRAGENRVSVDRRYRFDLFRRAMRSGF